MKTAAILIGALIILGLMITAAKRLSLSKERSKDVLSIMEAGLSSIQEF